VTPEIAPRIEDTVRARARRSYERGRLAVAGRNALLIVPLTAICGRETEAYARCAVIGGLLLLATIGVRWRQWRGPQAANAGLLTGILPMTAALLLCRFAAGWPAAAATAACASAGLIAGALAVRATLRMDALPPGHLGDTVSSLQRAGYEVYAVLEQGDEFEEFRRRFQPEDVAGLTQEPLVQIRGVYVLRLRILTP